MGGEYRFSLGSGWGQVQTVLGGEGSDNDEGGAGSERDGGREGHRLRKEWGYGGASSERDRVGCKGSERDWVQ